MPVAGQVKSFGRTWESLDELVRSAILDPNDILSDTSSKVSHQAKFYDIFSDLDVSEDWPPLNLSTGKPLPSSLVLSNLPHRRMISATLPLSTILSPLLHLLIEMVSRSTFYSTLRSISLLLSYLRRQIASLPVLTLIDACNLRILLYTYVSSSLLNLRFHT
jgi:hypothetical protein